MEFETYERTCRRQLIESLFRGDDQLAEVAEAMSVAITDLADVADDEMVVRTIRLLRMVGDVRLEQFFRPLRLHAMTRLLELCSQTENLELARKASVDLLKADMDSLAEHAKGLGVWASDEPVDDPPELMARALQIISQRGGAGMPPGDSDGRGDAFEDEPVQGGGE